MLICMAWHRHLASRYGGSTFSVISFLSPLVFNGRLSPEFTEQGKRRGTIIPAGIF
jgi:hypothetical protein